MSNQNEDDSATGLCQFVESLTTPYNEVTAVPTYTGLMFKIYAKTEIEILTFELDLRLDPTTTSDLSVEVFSKAGTYVEATTDISQWQQISNTKIMPFSSTGNAGAIIPQNNFTPVVVPVDSEQSFYITMNQPYIDITVDALQKTDEVQIGTTDFDLFVGSGFSEPRFPASGVNKTVDPQFAGIIHYRIRGKCEDLVDTSEIPYRFLFLVEAELPTSVLETISQTIDAKIDSILEENPALQSYKEKYSLQRLGETKTEPEEYTGECPSNWALCPTLSYTTTVKLSNQPELDPGLLKYELYRYATEIAEETASKVATKYPGTVSSYIGDIAIAASYEMFLIGVPKGVVMDDLQEQYFIKVTTDFLNDYSSNSFTNVFQITVDNQSAPERKQRRQLRGNNQNTERFVQADTASKTLIRGRIYGAQANGLTADNFQTSMDDAFVYGAESYVQLLKLAGLKPDTVDYSQSTAYFASITDASGSVTSVETRETNNPNSESTLPPATNEPASKKGGLIVGILVGVVAVVLAFIGFYLLYKACRDRKERVESRKKRRDKCLEEIEKAPPRQLERSQSFIVEPRKEPVRGNVKRSSSFDGYTAPYPSQTSKEKKSNQDSAPLPPKRTQDKGKNDERPLRRSSSFTKARSQESEECTRKPVSRSKSFDDPNRPLRGGKRPENGSPGKNGLMPVVTPVVGKQRQNPLLSNTDNPKPTLKDKNPQIPLRRPENSQNDAGADEDRPLRRSSSFTKEHSNAAGGPQRKPVPRSKSFDNPSQVQRGGKRPEMSDQTGKSTKPNPLLAKPRPNPLLNSNTANSKGTSNISTNPIAPQRPDDKVNGIQKPRAPQRTHSNEILNGSKNTASTTSSAATPVGVPAQALKRKESVAKAPTITASSSGTTVSKNGTTVSRQRPQQPPHPKITSKTESPNSVEKHPSVTSKQSQ